jgi:hypothetical protein
LAQDWRTKLTVLLLVTLVKKKTKKRANYTIQVALKIFFLSFFLKKIERFRRLKLPLDGCDFSK